MEDLWSRIEDDVSIRRLAALLMVTLIPAVIVFNWLPPHRLDDLWEAALASLEDRTVQVGGEAREVHWAVGELGSLGDERARWFATTDAFSRPETTTGFVANSRPAGQNFADFRSDVSIDDDVLEGTLYLVRLGDSFDDRTLELDQLAELLEAYYQMPVETMPPIPFEGTKLPGRSRPDLDHDQLKTGPVFDLLEAVRPDDAFGLLAVTSTGLYPNDDMNFVFGQAAGNRTAVVSLARLLEADRAKSRVRTVKLTVHEVGHLFGLLHCIYFECTMQGAWSLAKFDDDPLHLCPVELRKLTSLLDFDPESRYRQLRSVYRKHGFPGAANWVDRRLEEVTSE